MTAGAASKGEARPEDCCQEGAGSCAATLIVTQATRKRRLRGLGAAEARDEPKPFTANTQCR